MQHTLAAWFAWVIWCAPLVAQEHPPRPFGVEVAFGSGHADRGFLISDRAVVQPVAWVTGRLAEFSVWGSLPLAETTERSRPEILEMELTTKQEWGPFTIAPSARMFFYHDPLSPYSTHSVEGWLYLSYDVGPFSVFTKHSVDVRTYRGAYFGEAGLESAGAVSPQVELGGSVRAGWASARFNDAYAGVATSALNRVAVEGWLTARVNPCCYVSPQFEFSTIVNPAVRAELARPTFLLLKVSTGVEF